MSPGPENEKSRPRQGGQTSNSVTSRPSEDTPQVRQKPAPTRALAFATVVTSGKGVARVDLHWKCPTCGKTHASKAHGELSAVLLRRGPCGPVQLHIITAAVSS